MCRHCFVALTTLIVLLAGAPVEAQLPDKFINLQVLPKDIPRAELAALMRTFTGGLGVRCSHCHVEREGADELDFAADAKEAKQIARAMMRMTRDINGQYIGRLPAADGPRQRVECITCHAGARTPPRPLPDLLLSKLNEGGGVGAAIDEYRKLRRESLESGFYDFRERSLNTVAAWLRAQKRFDEALDILRFNAELFPSSAGVQASIGETAAEKGDAALAREAYRKALELDPKHAGAKHGLEELDRKSAPGRKSSGGFGARRLGTPPAVDGRVWLAVDVHTGPPPATVRAPDGRYALALIPIEGETGDFERYALDFRAAERAPVRIDDLTGWVYITPDSRYVITEPLLVLDTRAWEQYALHEDLGIPNYTSIEAISADGKRLVVSRRDCAMDCSGQPRIEYFELRLP